MTTRRSWTYAVRIATAVVLTLLAGCAPATLVGVVREGALHRSLDDIGSEEVTIFRAGAPVVPPPRHLHEGEIVETGPTTEVILRFPRAYVLVHPNTRVTVKCLIVNGPSERPIASHAEPRPRSGNAAPAPTDSAGTVSVLAHEGFRLHTELVDAAVKGTRYRFRLDRARVVHLEVFKGTVELQSRSHGWADFPVPAGEAADVHGAAPPERRPLSTDENAVLDLFFHRFTVFLDLQPGAF